MWNQCVLLLHEIVLLREACVISASNMIGIENFSRSAGGVQTGYQDRARRIAYEGGNCYGPTTPMYDTQGTRIVLRGSCMQGAGNAMYCA